MNTGTVIVTSVGFWLEHVSILVGTCVVSGWNVCQFPVGTYVDFFWNVCFSYRAGRTETEAAARASISPGAVMTGEMRIRDM